MNTKQLELRMRAWHIKNDGMYSTKAEYWRRYYDALKRNVDELIDEGLGIRIESPVSIRIESCTGGTLGICKGNQALYYSNGNYRVAGLDDEDVVECHLEEIEWEDLEVGDLFVPTGSENTNPIGEAKEDVEQYHIKLNDHDTASFTDNDISVDNVNGYNIFYKVVINE